MVTPYQAVSPKNKPSRLYSIFSYFSTIKVKGGQVYEKKVTVGYKGGLEEEKGRRNDAIIKYLKEILIFSFSFVT